MTAIAYYDNKLYADRRIITTIEGSGHSAFSNKTKITIAEDRTYAFVKDGVLFDKQKIHQLAQFLFKQLSCTDPITLSEIKKNLKVVLMNDLIGVMEGATLLAIKGKCFKVTYTGFIELPKDQLLVSGSGQYAFFVDHLLGYPVDVIYQRIAKTIPTVSKVFDTVNIDTDLVEYSTPLTAFISG